MSNLSKPQFGDLPMFLTAGEIQKYVTHSSDGYPDEETGLEGLWSEKEWDSKAPLDHVDAYGETHPHGGGVYDSIRDKGYDWNNPVTIVHKDYGRKMIDGHHRVAAAAAIERETGNPIWIPINHGS